MIDYIELTKHLQNKDKPFLGYLQQEATYSTGWIKYFVEGCRKLEIWWNPDIKSLKLKGSPLYFIQGHNFTWNKTSFVEAIKYIEKSIQINLFDAYVDELEYGTIMQINTLPKHIISGHQAGKGLDMIERPKDKGNIRYFNDKLVTLKLYDAGKNIIHKQGMTMQGIIQDNGWNKKSNYLKFEAHYNKPYISLNNGKGITLASLLLPEWEAKLKEDLFIQYKRLELMKSIKTPTSKNDLYSSDIILITLAEIAQNQGKDIKEMIYDRINSIPEKVLSYEDKKARKKQIKTMLEKLETSEVNEYSISDKLETALME